MLYSKHNVEKLYISNEYIKKNPRLHEEDTPWKLSKIIPFVEIFLGKCTKTEINLLDVGGGAGLILKAVAEYIRESRDIKVHKLALDLSPGMLEIQQANNPDLVSKINGNIQSTSYGDKEIDLLLMIDILEHTQYPVQALQEIQRISNYVIFKVPLEDSLYVWLWNIVMHGEPRRHAIEIIGHINSYRTSSIKQQIQEHVGSINTFQYANIFKYFNSSSYYKNKLSKKNKVINYIASGLYKLSPYVCSLIYAGCVLILVKCYNSRERIFKIKINILLFIFILKILVVP